LLTTPGAAKWYRADGGAGSGADERGAPGNGAEQNLDFVVGRDAVLEWLPRENIFFRGSDISMNLDVALSGSAKYLGWEILSFGRRARGERWDRGRLRMRTSVRRAGRLLWLETANIDAGGGFAASAVGLAGATVSGTFLVASGEIDDGLLKECREVDVSFKAIGASQEARIGLTRVPGVLIARYLGHSTQDAFRWFTRLWSVLRPAMLGREPCSPRVWAC
jgi:urease accessory protein